MRGQAAPNHRRRKDKESDSNVNSAAHDQTLKQQKQLNYRNHHIHVSIIIQNFNRHNSPIKRHYLANWIKKEDPTICCSWETHLIDRNKHWLRVKGWKKIYQANGPPKQPEVAILISDKIDLKFTLIKQDKEGHSILIKEEIHQKEITIINLYAPNVSAPSFIKHTLKDLKAYTDSNTVLVGDFNTHYHQQIGHPNKKSIKKF
jgi:hypothetical protein